MSLPTRQMGKNGPHVAAMGFGLMVTATFFEIANHTNLT